MPNRIQKAFDQIHASPGQKERTKRFLAQQTLLAREPKGRPIRRWAMALACCLMVALGLSGYLFYTTPVAAISVDINPSVELQVNRFGRVISLTSYNQDAQDLTQELQVENCSYQQAIQLLLEQSQSMGYLKENAWISICVVTDDQTLSSEMQQQVAACTGQYQNVECSGAGSEEHHAAQEAGVSMGKYRAFLRLQELDPSITLDQVMDLSMGELHDWIHSFGQDGAQSGSNGQGYGHGHGNHGANHMS